MKVCTKCKIELPTWCFGKRGAKKDGSVWLRSECNNCRSAMDKLYNEKEDVKQKKKVSTDRSIAEVTKRNREYVFNHLQKNPCVDCGEKDPIVLEFDHVRGKKARAVSQLIVRHAKLQAIIDEIAKCEVRCANCHARVTAKRGNFWKTYMLKV